MKSFKEYLHANGFSKASINSMTNMLSMYKRWVDSMGYEVNAIKYVDVLEYVKSLQKRQLSQRTIQHYVNAVRHYYDFLEVAVNPTSGVKIKNVRRNKLYRILEPNELNSLYQNYPDDTLRQKRDKVMLGLLCFQGITTHELSKLEVEDVDLKDGSVKIQGGRRSNGRTIELVSHQVMLLHEYLHEVRPVLIKMPALKPQSMVNDRNYLIISEGGRNPHFANLVAKLTKSLLTGSRSITDLRQIRASVITNWLKKYNKRKAQYLAGHRFISSTEAYERHNIEELKLEVDQFHPMDRN